MVFAIALVALVLVQQGKGAGMGASLGGGASQTVFGSRGAGSFLLKLTCGLAALFFATSLTLSYLANRWAQKPHSASASIVHQMVVQSQAQQKQQPSAAGKVAAQAQAAAQQRAGTAVKHDNKPANK
ncbi:MAG: preprotein translocase subunit SecG [Gammaproteobacteria bacterium]|nr:preprotein translocase subunit SecG [Gammaproteobacteria bacterium]